MTININDNITISRINYNDVSEKSKNMSRKLVSLLFADMLKRINTEQQQNEMGLSNRGGNMYKSMLYDQYAEKFSHSNQVNRLVNGIAYRLEQKNQ